MIGDLFDAFQFVCSAISGLFNLLDVLSALNSIAQFIQWSAEKTRELFQ